MVRCPGAGYRTPGGCGSRRWAAATEKNRHPSSNPCKLTDTYTVRPVSAPQQQLCLPVLSPTPVLENLPVWRRALAYAAVTVGDGIASLARTRTGGSGDLVVAFANLGDQLRFMNVWSRYVPAGTAVDIVCNEPTPAVFELFEGVGRIRAFGHQGAASLVTSGKRMLSRTPPYARGLVPHPFFTRPLALAYARTHAAEVIAMAGRGAAVGTTIPLDRASWRTAYERFAEACFPGVRPAARPRVRAHFRRRAPSKIAILHVAPSVTARAMPKEDARTLAAAALDLGFRPCAVGSAGQEERLRACFNGLEVRLVCGAPLTAVADLLCEAALFMGVDSAIMHVADALAVPCLVVYSATDPDIAGPFYVPVAPLCVHPHTTPLGVEPESSWHARKTSGPRLVREQVVAAAAGILERG
jgi:hypothetical protein